MASGVIARQPSRKKRLALLAASYFRGGVFAARLTPPQAAREGIGGVAGETPRVGRKGRRRYKSIGLSWSWLVGSGVSAQTASITSHVFVSDVFGFRARFRMG